MQFPQSVVNLGSTGLPRSRLEEWSKLDLRGTDAEYSIHISYVMQSFVAKTYAVFYKNMEQ